MYDWKIATTDSANGLTAIGAADSMGFATGAALITGNNYDEDNLSVNGNGKNQFGSIMVSPNPATSFFTIHYNSSIQQKVNAQLFDVNGKAVW